MKAVQRFRVVGKNCVRMGKGRSTYAVTGNLEYLWRSGGMSVEDEPGFLKLGITMSGRRGREEGSVKYLT